MSRRVSGPGVAAKIAQGADKDLRSSIQDPGLILERGIGRDVARHMQKALQAVEPIQRLVDPR